MHQATQISPAYPLHRFQWALASVIFFAGSLLAGEPESAPQAWQFSLGLSYLATGGNSDSASAGIDVSAEHSGEIWSGEAKLSALRSSRDSVVEAERYTLSGGADRKLVRRWALHSGVKTERDRFAGIALRTVVDLGAKTTLVVKSKVEIEFLLATTYTREELAEQLGTSSTWGGLAGGELVWEITDSASLKQRLALYTDFSDDENFRVEADTSIESAINARWALKFSYELRYDNQPVSDRKTTDTCTKASLVVRF